MGELSSLPIKQYGFVAIAARFRTLLELLVVQWVGHLLRHVQVSLSFCVPPESLLRFWC